MTRSRFAGGRVVVDGRIETVDLVVDAGRIVAFEAPRATISSHHVDVDVVDCTDRIVAPGFIDLQCNGAGGTDLTAEIAHHPDAIARVSRVLPRFGVTSFLPTLVTSSRSVRSAALAAMSAERGPFGAVPLGLHFEGPLISHDRLGAHVDEFVGMPEPDEVERWISGGHVALVTLAPEVPGARTLIETLTNAGIVVSAGHTAMTPADFAAARSAGLSAVTHLFNAMAPFDHRRPGPIGAALADDRVTVGLICDGLHVDPVAVRMAWRSLGPHRTSLVSDAAAPLGGSHGSYRLGAFDVAYDETGVRTADGTLAGSALALDQAVRNLRAFTGCDVVDALATVTTTPADLLGSSDLGRIAVGARADLAIIDDDANLYSTVIKGDVVWRS